MKSVAFDIAAVNKNIQEKTVQLHFLLESKNGKNDKIEKKKKAINRSRWYQMILFIRKKSVLRESVELNSRRNKKLDAFADVASLKLSQLLDFSMANTTISMNTRNTLDCVKYYQIPDLIPTIGQLAYEASCDFINDYKVNIGVINTPKQCSESLSYLYEFNSPFPTKEELNNKADNAIISGSDKIRVSPPLDSYEFMIRFLKNITPECLLLTPIYTEQYSVECVSQIAVSSIPCFESLFLISGKVRPVFSSLLRMTYPKVDIVDTDRSDTLDSEEIDLFLEKSRRDIDFKPKVNYFDEEPVYDDSEPNLFVFDLTPLFGDIEQHFSIELMRLPQVVVSEQVFSKDLFQKELEKSIDMLANSVIVNKSCPIPEQNLKFVENRITNSLYQFVNNETGIQDSIDELLIKHLAQSNTILSDIVTQISKQFNC